MYELESLTSHQKDALSAVGDFLRSEQRFFTLRGSAGTGKTYLTRVIVNSLQDKRIMAITAPTNKAVKVLSVNTIKHPNVVYQTTHSYLKLRESIAHDGSLKFERRAGEYPSNVSILVVDECSMVGSDLLEYIKQLPDKVKVIFVGDTRQINPVKEKISKTFDYPGFELTEILRQKSDSPILDFVYNFGRISPRNSCDKFKITSNSHEFVDLIKDIQPEKTIGWTNAYVDAINDWHRKRIYGNRAGIEFLEGEKLIMSAPIYSQDDKNVPLFGNSEEIIINSADKYEDNGLMIWNIDATGEGGHSHSIFIPAKESVPLYNKALKSLADEAKDLVRKKVNPALAWADFYELDGQFAKVKYSYAITAHKSQGSTYQSTAVNMRDIMKNYERTERDRILYTALTRASDTVLVLV